MQNIVKTALLLFLVASPLAAQRGGAGAGAAVRQAAQAARQAARQQPPEQLPVQQPAMQMARTDTGIIRQTPGGYVLDFQDQDIRVVLSAVAEAGNLNITFSNLPVNPVKRVTLRMSKAVSKAELLDVLRGLSESNGLKFSQTGEFYRIEGVLAPTALELQRQSLAQTQALAAQNQLRLYTVRLKHVSANSIAPVLMNLILGAGVTRTNATINGQAVQLNGIPGGNQINVPFQQAAPGGRGGGGGGAGGGGAGGGGAAQQAQALQAIEALSSSLGAIGNGALRNQILQGIQQAGGGGANFTINGVQQQQTPAPPGTLSAAANDIRIVAEESTNSLMIRATAQDFQILQGLIQTVDLRPLQVLIEVTIAEVQRNKDLSLGISGSATKHKAGSKDTASASFPTAATARDFVLMLTGGKGAVNYDVAINALQSRGDVKVLSMPVIIAQNNKEAILNVGSSRPFVQVQQTVANDPTGRVQTIQYIPVGKTLTITPTINADGYVNLAVKQTDNSATNEVQFDAPVINTREATTQVFLRNGQTTVIGGLADNDQRKQVSGIPILSRIPFIGGFLFGNTKQTTTASELFLFLTPHIISEDADIDKLRDAVKDGSELMQDMKMESRIRPDDVMRVRVDTSAVKPVVRPPVRPDSAARRPPPPEAMGDTAKKVQVPIKRPPL